MKGDKKYILVHRFYGGWGPIWAFCESFRLIGGSVASRFRFFDKTSKFFSGTNCTLVCSSSLSNFFAFQLLGSTSHRTYICTFYFSDFYFFVCYPTVNIVQCTVLWHTGCLTSYRIVIGSKLRFSRLIGKFKENGSLKKSYKAIVKNFHAKNAWFFKYYVRIFVFKA